MVAKQCIVTPKKVHRCPANSDKMTQQTDAARVYWRRATQEHLHQLWRGPARSPISSRKKGCQVRVQDSQD